MKEMKGCQRRSILTSVEHLHPVLKGDKLGDKISHTLTCQIQYCPHSKRMTDDTCGKKC